MVNLGTGCGVGLAFEGKLYRGATNSAGEWGHTTLDPDGPECRCGAKGCVEAYVGAPAILRQWGESDERARSGSQSEAMAALAAAWAAGEPAAVRTVATVSRRLAAGVANLVNLVNPDLVVLIGWVTRALGDGLMPELERRLPEHAMAAPLAAMALKRNSQERNMVCLGAAALALEGHLHRINTVGARARR